MNLEKYEVFAVPAPDFHLIAPDLRANFGDGIFVILAEMPESGQRRDWNSNFPQENGIWLHFGAEQITVFTGKAEVGQDIRTSLAQIVAEELRVAPESLRLVMADTGLTPFDMGTFGSRTTPFSGPHCRHVAAAAREWLLDLAAQHANALRESLSVEAGRIHHAATNRCFSFGELAQHQKLVTRLDASAKITSPRDWKVVGQPISKVTAREMATGAHQYTSDLTLPGLMWGKILRAPAFKTTLEALDDSAARATPGVMVVREGEFVSVVAPSADLAQQALDALQATWNEPIHPPNREVFDGFLVRDTSDDTQGARNSEPFVQGDISEGLAESDCVVEASYRIAYLAHAPLEPRAALAQWNGDHLAVWTGTQRPFGVREELSKVFEMPESQIRVIVPDTGSGYGGKHSGEAAIEAARLARVAKAPVKLLWTREEEFTWAYFRPGGLISARVGAAKDGKMTAWEFHNCNSGSAGIRAVYEIPHQYIEFHAVESPLRQGSYRALASTANHFARECLVDELAHGIGVDPLEFRLQNLKDERMRAVLLAATEKFGWKSTPAPNRGFGVAVGTEKNGFVANCVEISVNDGQIKVERIVTAFECGAIINPFNLRSQVEGAVVQGLGAALFEGITWGDGRIESNCFSKYRVPRFSDLPRLETVLLDRRDLPSSGGSEAPIIAVAAAIGNALFQATGVRLRSMPLAPRGIEALD